MTKSTATLGSLMFLIIGPGFVAGLVPWWITGWEVRGAVPAVAGALIVAVSLAALLSCFARFAWEGRGTPNPVLPTRTLVVGGLYRYVRNPMYLAILGIIAGQALLSANVALLVYAGFVWFAFHLFVLMYEEPALQKKYGNQYTAYASQVRRWLPRLSPYPANSSASADTRER